MNIFSAMIDFILHIDVHLTTLTAEYGVWTYLILFLIVFAETGLVVAPFLPGDSLLFTAGAVCALGTLDVTTLIALLIIAAVLGDALNYTIGNRLGAALFKGKLGRFIKQEHIDRTHAFYEKHGGKTIIIARFMPIIRTFAPFVAGIGKMSYRKFFVYNVVGAVAWVIGFIELGYLFGNQPFVKKYFTLVIGAIIVISILPGIIEFIRFRLRKNNA
ncbi:MAG: DedA family protein [Ignavibacteria bacterium]|nr:DedA family protein [Ignavibacteria bacterium]